MKEELELLVLLGKGIEKLSHLILLLRKRFKSRLSPSARELIQRMKSDPRSKVPGLTIFVIPAIGSFYEPAFAEPGLENEIRPGDHCLSDALPAIDELIAKGKLIFEYQINSMTAYRLVD